MFELSKKPFPVREEEIIAFWQEREIFRKSLEIRKKKRTYTFYDGPPFATGLPHYGHILAGTIKDVVPRYQTMKGYYVPRRFGWDCHGLPVENEIEKNQNLGGAPSIEAFGIEKFNEECRGIVQRYTSEWESTVNRMGRWVDFADTYRTMDITYMESVWWVLGQLWEKGLVYQGFKVMPFSAKLGTPLSNFEANLNYKDVDDPSVTVAFPLVDEDASLLVWTTTPWTLISNLAAIVHPELDYVKVWDPEKSRHFYLAKSRVGHYYKKTPHEVVEELKGHQLIGKGYTPPFDYFPQDGAYRVLADEFVGDEDGTGIVHAAPAFGETDFFVCSREGIEIVCPVDQNGKFTSEVPEYEGLFVKDADKDIIKRLKEKEILFAQATIRHRYPFCWRSDAPLIYKAVKTWFVSVEKLKDRLVEANKGIRWVPDHLKEGRFGKWLESARDWAISRNRYWGTPIPIWMSDDGDVRVVTSIEELERRTGSKVNDLHRHHIDHLEFEEDGKRFRRIPEVFDCWFESGSMPYAQNHFPFENQEATLSGFPADFIAEGLDQTRGWFYTLTVLGVALFDKPAFSNVIVNGILLAEDGNKMSKRLKNYPEPEVVINKYGADSIRLYLLNSPSMEGDDLRFSERGVELVLRQVLIPFWNAYVFLATYAKIYKWKPSDLEPAETDIDRWIISRTEKLIKEVDDGMQAYKLSDAVKPFVGFIDELTNWYIRRCRNRFWADDDTPDRRQAFSTLYSVLLTLTKVTAPFVPFISEAIYRELASDPISVHLCDFPTYNPEVREESLEDEMALVQQAVSMGHALRKEHKLRVRQPLAKAHIVTSNSYFLDRLSAQKHLICDELNVKDIEFHAEESSFVTLIVKPNFRILGKKVGPMMREAQEKIGALSSDEKQAILSGEKVSIELMGEPFFLSEEDVSVEREVVEGLIASSSGGVTIALDTALTEELLLEGLAREVVNKLNTMRRDAGLEVTDRIEVRIESTDRVRECFDRHGDYIRHEVLATDVGFVPTEGTEWDLCGEKAVIFIRRQE